MPRYRTALPQLSGDIFLADGGVETDLIFNHGIEIREFAAHTLLPTPEGRAALTQYFEAFLILLHHKVCRRIRLAIGAAQHGHRGSLLTRAAISRRRTVAIEFGMCRSGRRGGASGSVTVG